MGWIGDDPTLLRALVEFLENRVKLLHVVRHPFDVIAAIFRKSSLMLPDAVRFFFRQVWFNDMIRRTLLTDQVLDIKHELMVGNPTNGISRVYDFLGVSCGHDYLKACSGLVFKAPRRSRDTVV